MDPLVNFGIVNSLRTGNYIIDIIIAMAIPGLITFITNNLTNIMDLIKKWFRKTNHFTRVVEFTVVKTPFENNMRSDDDDNTPDLIRAIQLYIMHQTPSTYTQGSYKLIDFLERCDDDEEDEQYDDSRLRRLRDSKLVDQPNDGNWIQLTGTVKVMYETEEDHKESSDKKDNIKLVKVKYTFVSTHKTEPKKDLDAFINTVMKWYENEIKKYYVKRRSLYLVTDTTGGSKGDRIYYKKYALDSNKTFNTLFVPNKSELINLIDDFTNHRNKFSVPGMPKQICLLLTGPPGTGKTSLIKCLSQHTDRHVIDVPLGKINTNAELYKVMFDRAFDVGYGVDKYKFNKLIFVLEDVDCISDIVKRRDTKESNTKESNTKEDNTKDVDNLKEYAKVLKSKYNLAMDQLTLSGILNVIDGVVDCPDRILIMTTNHPEKLDPALIRPGRVTMAFNMSYVEFTEAKQMVEHYVGPITEAECVELKKGLVNVTPATLESYCISCNTVQELLCML